MHLQRGLDRRDLAPQLLRLFVSSLLFAQVRQPFGDIRAVPDISDREPLSQKLLGPVQVSRFRAGELVAIRPADPAPSPARIDVQPAAIERLRFLPRAQFVIGLRQSATPVLGHEVFLRVESPQSLFADRDPGAEELPVLQPRIPQLVLEILNPVEQRLTPSESVIELADKSALFNTSRYLETYFVSTGPGCLASGNCSGRPVGNWL